MPQPAQPADQAPKPKPSQALARVEPRPTVASVVHEALRKLPQETLADALAARLLGGTGPSAGPAASASLATTNDDDLRTELAKAVEAAEVARARIADLEGADREARTLLRKHEWTAGACIECGRVQQRGHTPICRLLAAIDG